MPISARLSSGLAALALVATTAHLTGASAPAPAKTAKTIVRKAADGFELSVDSIMRGPKLVGYPPAGLRWSGDSSRLYFEWRKAGEDEASTWVVARDGGQPRKRDPRDTDSQTFIKAEEPKPIEHTRMFTPEMVGAKRDPAAPAVVFVHGAGYLQNAHKYWSSYGRWRRSRSRTTGSRKTRAGRTNTNAS